MNTTPQDPQGFPSLTPTMFHILLALADREKHGYAIMREVETHTDGRLKLGPGTLYGSIKQMLAAGLMEESEDRPDPALDDQRRRYYRLTGFGRQVASEEARRLAQLVNLAQRKNLLGDMTLKSIKWGMGVRDWGLGNSTIQP